MHLIVTSNDFIIKYEIRDLIKMSSLNNAIKHVFLYIFMKKLRQGLVVFK